MRARSNSARANQTTPKDWIARLSLTLVASFGLYTLYRALTLRVDYWDAFLYLNNARALLGDAAAHYQEDKPPVLPLLYAPVVAATQGHVDSVWMWIGPHLVAALLSLGCVYATFLVFRETHGRRYAALAALLIMGNRIFVRYGAMTMTDVWAMGSTALAFASWLVATRKGSYLHYGVCGVAFGIATASRYQLGIVPFAFLTAEIVHVVQMRRLLAHRWLGGLLVGVVGAAVFVLLHWAFFRIMGRGQTLEVWLEGFRSASAGALRDHPDEEPWHYLQMLTVVLSPAFLGVAAVGLGMAAFRRNHRDWIFLFWAVFVGGSMFRIDHNEVRYLYPAFPALVYFVLVAIRTTRRGLERLQAEMIRPRAARTPLRTYDLTRGSWLGATVVGAALLCLVWPGVDQIRRDHDPFFRTDVTGAATAWLLRHAPKDARFYWLGRSHSRHPEDISLLVHDEFFDMFHFGPHEFSYFSGRPMAENPWFRGDPQAEARRLAPHGAGVLVGAMRYRGGTVKQVLEEGAENPRIEALVVHPGASAPESSRVERATFP